MLQVIHHHGQPVRILLHGGTPFVCVKDLLLAAGLTGKANPSMMARKAGASATIRIKRSSYPDEFGKVGSAYVLFLSLDALDKWARPYPDGAAATVLRLIREAHWRPFASAE